MMPDDLTIARTALAASSQTDDPEVAACYTAAARVALVRARDQVRELSVLLKAREAELVRRVAVKEQLPLEGDKP